MKKAELLAPAGDMEKLKIAIEYGADAVYFGGELFSLRSGAGNFSIEEIQKATDFVHERGKKCYLTVNIFPHNEDIEPLRNFLSEIKDFGIDGYLISDPGVLDMLKEIIPRGEIHLSTQANMTNYRTADFWVRNGVKRIVLARELSIDEIIGITGKLPEGIETEVFVHGAMCISYSGRCLLSNFMIERDANRGECAHPCRWQYALLEQERPGQYYPIEEDERGTYILNSRDLCMIEHIPELVDAGIASLKIEGRMKSVFYVATVVGAYRRAIDAYYEGRSFDPVLMDELRKVSHREFTTGFFFNKPTNKDQNYQSSEYTRDYSFVGKVLDYEGKTGMAKVEQRNKMSVGETIEIFGPSSPYFEQELEVLLDEDGEATPSAPHPQQIVYIKTKQPVRKNFLIRKRKVK